MRVHMGGAEWFSSRAGGLNRYFADLFNALQGVDGIDVGAQAFGEPPDGGRSWGPPRGNLASRMARSRRSALGDAGEIVDLHFAAYGRAHRAALRVVHFQGPWAAESEVAGDRKANVAVKRLLEGRRYSRADAVIALSRGFADLAVTDYGVEAGRVHVIPPGVDLARFRPEPASPKPQVLCVRRLEKRMGIDLLLAGWGSVVDRVPDAQLVIVGDGSERAALERQARSLTQHASVTFTGRLSDRDLAAAYREAAVTCVPTRALEGFGLIALESLATGRPPVVTAVGGLPDSVRGLDPTLVVEPDPNALARRLADALNGNVPDAEECRRHAETFDWRGVATHHRDLYASLR